MEGRKRELNEKFLDQILDLNDDDGNWFWPKYDFNILIQNNKFIIDSPIMHHRMNALVSAKYSREKFLQIYK